MIFIKIFLIFMLTLSFVLFAFSSKWKIFQKLSILTGYFTTLFFIIFPKVADKIAHIFSIKSGTDLMVYITLALMSLISIIIYIKVKNNGKILTKIIRNEACKNARKCK